MSLQAETRQRRWPRIVLGVASVVALVVGVVAFTPLFDADLSGDPDPASGHEEAMALAEELLAADSAAIADVCHSRVVDHGRRTEHAVVLLHGYTNCPAQFGPMAEAYARAGASVVVPRLPDHGEADRLTDALSDLGPQEITATTDLAVDIAAGLGDRVTVVGLSGGGTAAGWAAATRDDVDEAVLIAPLVVPRILPASVVYPVARLSRFAPDVHIWWDGDRKAELDEPPYAYPRFSVRSLGAFLAVGHAARAGVTRTSDLDRLVVVTNDNDAAINNAGAESLANALDPVARQRVDHRFPASLGLRHDLVDPEGENAARLPEVNETLAPLLELPELAASTE